MHPERGEAERERTINATVYALIHLGALRAPMDTVAAVDDLAAELAGLPAADLAYRLACLAVSYSRTRVHRQAEGVELLAIGALNASVAGKTDEAHALLRQIPLLYGPGSFRTAMLTWCDAYTVHATAGQTDRSALAQPPAVAFRDPAHPLWWAARLVKARIEMDKLGFEATIDMLGNGDARRYVLAVLSLCAEVMAKLPEGWALEGDEG